jgi:hypothetical protein
MEKLAKLVPARYAKYEESSGYLASINSFSYELVIPEPPVVVAPKPAEDAEGGAQPVEEGAATMPDASADGAPVNGSPVSPTPATEKSAPSEASASPESAPAVNEPASSTPVPPADVKAPEEPS